MTEGFKDLARALGRSWRRYPPACGRRRWSARPRSACSTRRYARWGCCFARLEAASLHRDRLDLVGVVPGSHPPEVRVAFVVDPLVELAKIKALEWVECPDKVVVTFSRRTDKVKQSTFFLAPGLGMWMCSAKSNGAGGTRRPAAGRSGRRGWGGVRPAEDGSRRGGKRVA